MRRRQPGQHLQPVHPLLGPDHPRELGYLHLAEIYPTPVLTEIGQTLPWTLGLVGIATIISFAIGTLLGDRRRLAPRRLA